jgi:hypothetical protein
MGADIEAGLREEGCQPPVFNTRVTWMLPVYNHRIIQEHHRAVNQEFGLPYLNDGRRTERRYIRSAGTGTDAIDSQSYTINYYFRDPHDAILFSLKYVK